MLLKHSSDQSVCFLFFILSKQLKMQIKREKMVLVALFLPLAEHTSPTSAIFQFYSSLSLEVTLKFGHAVA
jgi:hypothetical protein